MSIYIVRAGEDGPVKIGYAVDIDRRVAILQTASPARLHILRRSSGTRKDETIYHRAFERLRIAGEWFVFSPEMLSFEPRMFIPPEMPKRVLSPAASKEECGARLLTEIKRTHRTVSHWGRTYGVLRSACEHWVKGNNWPDWRVLSIYCDEFDLSLDWIVRGIRPEELRPAEAAQ